MGVVSSVFLGRSLNHSCNLGRRLNHVEMSWRRNLTTRNCRCRLLKNRNRVLSLRLERHLWHFLGRGEGVRSNG